MEFVVGVVIIRHCQALQGLAGVDRKRIFVEIEDAVIPWVHVFSIDIGHRHLM